MTGSTVSAGAAALAWLALQAVGSLAAIGVAVPRGVAIACATLAGPFVLAAGVRAVASAWLGPPLVAFSPSDSALCGPIDAALVRNAAQLRGTMGGAGHLHRERLVFPAVAWLAAAAAGAEAIVARGGVLPVALAAGAALAAWRLPSRPYWYREVVGGRVIVNPPAAAVALAARATRARLAARAAEPGPGR